VVQVVQETFLLAVMDQLVLELHSEAVAVAQVIQAQVRLLQVSMVAMVALVAVAVEVLLMVELLAQVATALSIFTTKES
jgi:hypothetical protein